MDTKNTHTQGERNEYGVRQDQRDWHYSQEKDLDNMVCVRARVDLGMMSDNSYTNALHHGYVCTYICLKFS